MIINNKFSFFYAGTFSQWFPSEFTVNNIRYNTAEQYMMHQKALLFGDLASAEAIMNTNKPRDQKAIGRKVSNFDAARWNGVARDIVYEGNWNKFKQNSNLLDQLNSTDGTLLVEASPTDPIWGIGIGMDHKELFNPEKWRGTNWLGEVLTKVREDIKEDMHRTEGFNWSS